MSPHVLVVTSHAIQYNAPLFRRIAERGEIDLSVAYQSRLGTPGAGMEIDAFRRAVTWDVDLLSGYASTYLRRASTAHPEKRMSMFDASVVSALRPSHIDIVVLFGWAFPTDWVAAATATARNLPFLLYTDTDVRDRGASRQPFLRRAALQVLLSRAAGALYTGTFNRDFYIRAGMSPEALWFSPWSVENERFAGGDRAAGRHVLGLKSDVCYMLFVGTLIERKRPKLLLDAVKSMQARGLRVGALFAGTGPLEGEIRKYAESVPDIHLLGFVNQQRLPQIYAAADVFVLPTTKDPRATVINEAMAAGLPVVITDGTGIWGPGDLVRDGQQGCVVPRGDRQALVRALERLLDEDLRRDMGAAASERVAAWNFDVAAQGWEDAAHALVAPHNR